MTTTENKREKEQINYVYFSYNEFVKSLRNNHKYRVNSHKDTIKSLKRQIAQIKEQIKGEQESIKPFNCDNLQEKYKDYVEINKKRAFEMGYLPIVSTEYNKKTGIKAK